MSKPFQGWSVRPLPYVAANIIQCMHHYLHSQVQSVTHSFGLYDPDGAITGVLMFGPPSGSGVAGSFFGQSAAKVADLKRMWLHDEVPGNGESFFMAGAMGLLRGDYEAIVAYADPIHHTGRVYLAANFTYCGQGTAQATYYIHGKAYNARAVLNGITTDELRDIFGSEFQVVMTPGKLRYARVIVQSPRARRAELESLLSVAASRGEGRAVTRECKPRVGRPRKNQVVQPRVALRDMSEAEAAAFYQQYLVNQTGVQA